MIDLAALLQDDRPLLSDERVTLLAARVEAPSDYLFESDVWQETVGAGQQLLTLAQRLKALCAASQAEVLYADQGYLLAFMQTQAAAASLCAQLERCGPDQTGVLQMTTACQTAKARDLFEGLYPIPTQVIGIPGVNSYQGRINRYYGVASPSTIPSGEAVARRRHFGQVVSAVRTGLQRALEVQDVVPFYEVLPFFERCASCRVRPAETLRADQPICGICNRKREAAPKAALEAIAALGVFSLPDAPAALLEQRTPAAYRRTAILMDSALRKAVIDSGGRLLWLSEGAGLVTWSVRTALSGASKLSSSYLAQTRDSLKQAFPLSIGLAIGHGSPRMLAGAAQAALGDVLRTTERGQIGLALLDHQTEPHRTASLYSTDSLARLDAFANELRRASWPAALFTDLPTQIARGTVTMYYVYGRARLDEPSRRLLDRIEEEWGRESMRFYGAFSDALGMLNVDKG